MRLDDVRLRAAGGADRAAAGPAAAGVAAAGGDAATRSRDSTVARLGDWLERGDLLVLNDTRVMPARLAGVRRRAGGAGARIEATLVARTGEGSGGRWRGRRKRLAVGDRIDFGGGLAAEVRAQGRRRGACSPSTATSAALEAALEAQSARCRCRPTSRRGGRRTRADREDYQTVFAARPGAVAAPTASLHFDDGAPRRARGARGRSGRS